MSPDREEKFMRMALDLAVENVTSGRGGPFAVIIVKGDEVIATGTSRIVATNDPTAHAEISALQDASARLGTTQFTGCEVYASCEPCPLCLGALYWARPDRIYSAATRDDASASGFADSFVHDEITLEFGGQNVTVTHILEEEASRPFDVWEQKEDKVRY